MSRNVYICEYVRTPIGRFGGCLSSVRADDLGAIPLKAIIERHKQIDWSELDEVVYGCANQAGEDNRNVARMSLLLAGLPTSVPGTTLNRLCGSGMDAFLTAARAIALGETDLAIAGGVESMSRAPFVMPKAESAFSRSNSVYDTTIGWRFVNPKMQAMYGIDSMPETGENVATQFHISRSDQDKFALASQQKASRADSSGRFAKEIVGVEVVKKRERFIADKDEHLRPGTTLDDLAKLSTPFKANGSVTAGNASGVNDGAAALLLASEEAVNRYGLTPIARYVGGATAGVEPKIMGFGPAPASEKLLKRLKLSIDELDVIELNEAFASQALASARYLGLQDDDHRVNPNGGAIALGHPLGMSGARLIGTAALELKYIGGRYGLATMCIGVGQGIASIIEAV
ncbi:3-oxoadipyl-CoA thiolase [Marinobacterium mangrovicola]|uniref:Beta-ketoadipyl-CoA thiolase n=1 Tax=Marinobacterium mangrovicola TaxID=1476959 RepID=A0A4R1GFF3_9GAMM|nr:3-oxoadipyl-CoA thiolase [Marinobacterium mangrovicola]TCK02932.1 3-oxoadipyl-CoA thiolase [Marinobacterium mangrovicola]